MFVKAASRTKEAPRRAQIKERRKFQNDGERPYLLDERSNWAVIMKTSGTIFFFENVDNDQ